jgi:serine/threonine protein kinase
MGRVFLGVSAAGRPVAVKIIHAELAADPEFRARFAVEVAAARKVSGLFTALVVDADVDAPVPWLATAYVNGPSLSEAVRDGGPLSAPSLLALAAALAKSLSAVHAAGVVHGDLTPSNVLLALDGPRVIDFGIPQAAEAAPPPARPPRRSRGSPARAPVSKARWSSSRSTTPIPASAASRSSSTWPAPPDPQRCARSWAES